MSGPPPLTPARRASLQRLLNPRHVAFVGGKWAHRSAQHCRRLGFAGEIWVVNPRPLAIEGTRWFADIDQLPEAPDASFLAVNREATVDMVARLAARGAGGAVCFAAGYAEVGADGAALQQALLEAAGESFAFTGPNCWGLVNYVERVSLWPDVWQRPAPERGVAIISQSGNLSITLSSQDRSLPLSYVLSVGNQAQVGQSELIATLAGDERVSAIALYMETIPDVQAFARAALKARERGVPVVAVKVGASEQAARVTLSHTSSLAGSDELCSALFERVGVVRAHTLAEMLETIKLLSCGGGLSGRRLVSLSCSGGDAALMADHGERLGLEYPPFRPQTAARLREQLSLYTSIGNPFDYNTGIWGDRDAIEQVFSTAIGDDFDAAVFVIDTPPPPLLEEGQFMAGHEGFIAACRNTGRRGMVLSMLAELCPSEVREPLFEAGIAPLQGLHDGLAAIRHAAWYGGRVRDIESAPPLLPSAAKPLVAGKPVTLDEVQSKTLLAAHGLVVPEARVSDAAGVPAAARALGFPVVLKAVDVAIAHKSEAGAVAVNLGDEAALARALATMQARLGGHAGPFLVERMVEGVVLEMIVGVKRDEQFGPVLVLGAGGVLVELMRDSLPLLLPLTRADVESTLDRLAVARLLGGFRGAAAGDRAALVEAVMAVAAFAESHADRLLELDLNPLLVRAAGDGVVAADALVRLVAPPQSSPSG